MENYIVSARKYRPATFESVVGQHALTITLKNAIATGKLAHAYLFCGPRGVGKTTCARIFAKTINCQTPTAEGEACNQCESCLAFNEQRSYNIHELDAASNNSVEDIRSQKRSKNISTARQVSMYIVREITQMSMTAIGEEFGGRDHSTVVYTIKIVQSMMDHDSYFRETVDDIIKNLRAT